MSNETEHALEQAERIVQYAKYSDRFMVVESGSLAERRAFVKLVRDKLPVQVDSVAIHAQAGAPHHAPIHALGTALQLSAGIRETDELHRAATATLDTHDRLLVIIENVDAWLDSDAADTLYDLIEGAHEHAREQLLFLLVGRPGLCSRLETAQPLATVIADLYCVRLLGTEPPRSAPAAAAATETSSAASSIDEPADFTASEPVAPAPEHQRMRRRQHGRPIWTQPPFLIAAVVSVAVITIGIFALLSRSGEPERPAETSLALDTTEKTTRQSSADRNAPVTASTEDATSTEDTASSPDTEAPDTAAPETPAAPVVDHGEPPHVPFPKPKKAESRIASAEEAPQEVEPTPTPTTEPSADTTDTTEAGDPTDATETAVDNAWFREQPRARAVVQLAAFTSLDMARQMIETHSGEPLPADDWRVYTQRVNDRLLYTVTWGDFSSIQRARHAIDSLPEALRSLEPYPRSVGDVQDRLVDQ
ncbi:MAG: SPOR domain-containing protein [Pseudomonadota bacterium]